MSLDNTSNNSGGCWIGVLILIFFVFISVKGCITRSNKDNTRTTITYVNVISSDKRVSQVKVDKAAFIGKDTIYIGSENVYQNVTGRALVKYMVKYTTSGSGYDTEKPSGTIIFPDEYFFWLGKSDSYRMFVSPPASTTIVTRSRRNKRDFTYLTFLDFAENVSNTVNISGF